MANLPLKRYNVKTSREPTSVLPARELLGDLLMAQQKPAQALQAYEATLTNAPGRFNSVAGRLSVAKDGPR